MKTRLLPYGERAVLAEVDTVEDVVALHTALEAARGPGIVEIVPAARTVTVVADRQRLPLSALRAWIQECAAAGLDAATAAAASTPDSGPGAGSAAEVVIDVEYTGEDLPEVAQFLGLSVPEVIAAHTRAPWRVAFGGFALGFGYLVTEHNRLIVPRRDAPRSSVPAGAVGLAGEFSGVYPRSGPGGWQLIGTTDAVLWDGDRNPPALLRPGTSVRFRSRS